MLKVFLVKLNYLCSTKPMRLYYLTHLWPHQAWTHLSWKQTFLEEALELGCCCSFDSGSPYCLIPLKDNMIIWRQYVVVLKHERWLDVKAKVKIMEKRVFLKTKLTSIKWTVNGNFKPQLIKRGLKIEKLKRERFKKRYTVCVYHC